MSRPKKRHKNQSVSDVGVDEKLSLPKTTPLQLRYYGDPVLRKKAEPVQEITDVEIKLANDMLLTLYTIGNGIGLAATQVGVLKRFIIIALMPDEEREYEPLMLFNPEILSVEGEDVAEEGCLSLPNLQALVKRPEKIVVRALNINGEQADIEADGLLSRVLQHEIDHLNGILFIDRISGIKRQLLSNELNQLRQAERPLY